MRSWDNRRVVIVGAARQGLALARYLVLQGALVTLNDRRPASEFLNAQGSLEELARALPETLTRDKSRENLPSTMSFRLRIPGEEEEKRE